MFSFFRKLLFGNNEEEDNDEKKSAASESKSSSKSKRAKQKKSSKSSRKQKKTPNGSPKIPSPKKPSQGVADRPHPPTAEVALEPANPQQTEVLFSARQTPSQDNESNRSQRSFRQSSARKLREMGSGISARAKKVSRIVSRPIKDQTMNRFLERVSARKQAREEMEANNKTALSVHGGDIIFPGFNDPAHTVRVVSTESDASMNEKERRHRMKQIFPDIIGQGHSPGKAPTVKANSNNGAVIVDGSPFWMLGEKISKEEKDEITADDLPLTADVILEVKQGKCNLAQMPETKLQFDPYHPMDVLFSRDPLLFSHEMIFANTIRSMINLTDDSVDMEEEQSFREASAKGVDEANPSHRSKAPEALVSFDKEPETYTVYTRGRTSKNKEERYVRTGGGLR